MTIALRSQRTATALLTLGCVATADQLSKSATADLPPDTVAFIHPLRNHAFSLQLLNAPRATEITLMLLILTISTAWAVKRIQQGRLHPAAAGLIIGGCASNIVDRVLLGSVRDSCAWVTSLSTSPTSPYSPASCSSQCHVADIE